MLGMGASTWGVLVLAGAVAAGVHSTAAPPATAVWEQVPPEARLRPNPLMATPDVLKKGRALFSEYCLLCHGEKGHGDGPTARMHAQRSGHTPADLSAIPLQQRLADGEIFWKVTHGLKRDGKIIMPGLSDRSEEDRWSLVLYVRSLAATRAAK